MNVTKREFLVAAGILTGSSLSAETILMRSRTGFKSTMTTLFWVGDPSDAENAFIPNNASYWDGEWQTRFGGVDDPRRRNGYWPAAFRPKENPLYVALPYGEFVRDLKLRPEAQNIPWYRRGLSPLLKNRRVEIRRAARSCYAQWQDVGPCNEDDFHFVFGYAAKPRNTFELPRLAWIYPLAFPGHEGQRTHLLALRRRGRRSRRSLDRNRHDLGQQSRMS